MLGLIPLPYRLAGVGILLLGLVGGFLAYRQRLIKQGEDRVITKIEDANHASEKKADVRQKTVDQCYAAGLDWDRSRGLCVDSGAGK